MERMESKGGVTFSEKVPTRNSGQLVTLLSLYWIGYRMNEKTERHPTVRKWEGEKDRDR